MLFLGENEEKRGCPKFLGTFIFQHKLPEDFAMPEISLTEAMNIVKIVVGKLEELYDHHPDAIGIEGEDPNDPWRQYVGYGEDKYLVSYLEGIDAEVTNWIIAGVLDDNK